MKIIHDKKSLIKKIQSNSNIGFVPTMGFLHDGHLSLVKQSKLENETTIVSIFVNPLQFGKNEDLDSYPRDHEKDLDLLKKENVDIVFFPQDDFYHPHHQTIIQNSSIRHKYCGATRKNHFDGVLTVVAKFFNLIRPKIAYFGEKDFQQFFLIKKMTTDLDFLVDVKPSATIRENNGLAMSSRNKYLSQQQREKASFIYQALKRAKEKINNKENSNEQNISKIIKDTILELKSYCSSVEYLVLVDEQTLMEASIIEKNKNYRLLVAVQYCSVRLIDNLAI